jgi:hypothetical protein
MRPVHRFIKPGPSEARSTVEITLVKGYWSRLIMSVSQAVDGLEPLR